MKPMNTTELTPPQFEAATSPLNRIKVIAGPGTGKTHTLAARVKGWVDAGVPAERIAAITFSRRGAEEITKRCKVRPGYAGTIHGLATHLTAIHDPEAARLMVASNTVEADTLSMASTLFNVPQKAIRAQLVTPHAELAGAGTKHARAALWVRAQLMMKGMTTFDLILAAGTGAVKAGATGGFTHVILDEAQDSGAADWALVEAMQSAVGGSVCAVGDPAQTLYEFRGAKPELLMVWRASLAVYLTECFRCPPEVCAFANNLRTDITHDACLITPRPGAAHGAVRLTGSVPSLTLKEWWSGGGSRVVLASQNRDVGVLASVLNHNAPTAWRAELDKCVTLAQSAVSAHVPAKVPEVVMVFGTEPVAPALVHDWLASTTQSEECRQALYSLEDMKHSVAWVRELAGWRPPPPPDRHVGTVHSAKGGEWDHVWFASPDNLSNKPDAMRRTYVAATRARKTLTMSGGVEEGQ